MSSAESGEDLGALAETLTFHNQWDVWLKVNTADWTRESFHFLTAIVSIADMWRFLNNIPDMYLGTVNLFVMRHPVFPLFEENGDAFVDLNAGSWSVVVKRLNWKKVIINLVMTALGETIFCSRVQGLCFVPVTNQQVICKVWATSHSCDDGSALQRAFGDCSVQASAPRYKSFR